MSLPGSLTIRIIDMKVGTSWNNEAQQHHPCAFIFHPAPSSLSLPFILTLLTFRKIWPYDFNVACHAKSRPYLDGFFVRIIPLSRMMTQEWILQVAHQKRSCSVHGRELGVPFMALLMSWHNIGAHMGTTLQPSASLMAWFIKNTTPPPKS